MTLEETGREVLGISSRASDRHGGPEHRYWVHRIADHLRAQGYNISIEHPIGNGKTVDILATRHGRKIAFEIETGKSDAAANARKCLEGGIDKVVVVATSNRVREALTRRLPLHPSLPVTTAYEATGWPM